MHPLRKQRLITFLVIFFAISIAILLVVRGLSSNLNLFYTPTELKNSSEIKGINIRAGGMVLKDSVVKSKTSLEVQFQITDYENNLLVKYRGVLPDLFSEDAGVVVQGGGPTVLALSFTGATITPDCGLLTSLSLDNEY